MCEGSQCEVYVITGIFIPPVDRSRERDRRRDRERERDRDQDQGDSRSKYGHLCKG